MNHFDDRIERACSLVQGFDRFGVGEVHTQVALAVAGGEDFMAGLKGGDYGATDGSGGTDDENTHVKPHG